MEEVREDMEAAAAAAAVYMVLMTCGPNGCGLLKAGECGCGSMLRVQRNAGV